MQILGPYVNYVGVTRDGAGHMFIAATQVRPGDNNDAVVIMKRDVMSGLWTEIARLTESSYGKPGFCSLAVVVDDLHVIGSFRNTVGEQVVMEHVIPNVCVSWRDALTSAIKEQLAALPATGAAAVGGLAKAIGDAVAPYRPK